MKVSVFLPTYRQAQFLEQALAGLRAQTFQDFELIVCDDGSDDDTQEILEDAAPVGVRLVKVRHEENKGTAEAINSCSREAQGSLWTWVSSDNVMSPTWLEVLVGVLDSQQDLGAAFSAFTQVRQGGSSRGIFKRHGYRPGDLISSENCFFGPSFLIRAEVWRRAGGHRGKISHDYDHWARVEEACWDLGLGILFVPQSLCDYYIGPWQATVARRGEYDAGHWRAEALRRRAQHGREDSEVR